MQSASHGGMTSGASAGETGESESSGGETTGTSFHCEANYVPPQELLEVAIVNAGAEAIVIDVAVRDYGPGILDEFYAERAYTVIDPETEAIVNERGLCFGVERCTPDYWCPYTFDTEDHDPCDPEPGRPGPIVISPGGRYEPPPWDGLRYEDAVLPYECQNQLCGVPVDLPTECRRAFAVAGELIARVQVGAAIECLEADSCACTPNQDGWCRAGVGIVVDPVAVEVGFVFPEVQAIEVVIP